MSEPTKIEVTGCDRCPFCPEMSSYCQHPSVPPQHGNGIEVDTRAMTIPERCPLRSAPTLVTLKVP